MSSLSFPDVNVWLSLLLGSHIHRAAAKSWWEGDQSDVIAFVRLTQLSVLRLLTTPAAMNGKPLTMPQAWTAYDRLFADDQGIRLVDCLAPTDRRVTARLLPALDSGDLSTRLWAAYALSRRVPLDEDTLIQLIAHAGDPSPDLRARLRWIFTIQEPLPAQAQRTLRARDPRLAEQVAEARRTVQREAQR